MRHDDVIPSNCRALIHSLNQRYREQWDRAERLQAELDDIKGSRAWTVFRWLRGLRRWVGGRSQARRVAPSPPCAARAARLLAPDDSWPPTAMVSILIPFKDHLELLRNCLHGLRRGTYRRLQIVLLDNGSTSPEMRRYLRRLKRRRGFRVVHCPGDFNFARICNLGARRARGEYLLFLNNDIEVQTPDWLERMLAVAAVPQVGIVGAALLYPDGTVQHAGIEPTTDDEWEHVGRGMNAAVLGEQAREASAVTGACLLMRRDRFMELGGFDERFPVTHNDVDLCCRARRRGWLVALAPRARLVHFESLSRGYARS